MDRRLWTFAAAACAGALLAGAALFAPRLWPDGGCPERGDRTLVVLGDRDVSSGRQRREAIEKWRGPGGMRAELRELPGVADLQHSETAATAQAGGCGIDVYLLDGPWIAEFAEAGHLAPLAEGPLAELEGEEPLNGLLTGELRRSGYHGGRLWAVPFSADAPLLYYRRDLLEKAGLAPPRTWEEVWDHAERVLADPPPGLRAGYAAQLARYEGFTVNALELLWAYDSQDIVADGEVRINRNGLQNIRARLEPADGPTVIARESFTWHEDEATEAFVTGKTLFMRGWPTAYRRLAEDPEVEDQEDLTKKYGVTVLPDQGVLGGQSLAVAADSPYKEEARDLIRTLTGYEAQNRLFWCGGFASVRAEVYDRREKADCETGGSNDPDAFVVRHLPQEELDRLREAIENARPRPVSPHYTWFSRVFQELLYCELQTPPRVPQCPQDPEPLPHSELEERLTRALNGR